MMNTLAFLLIMIIIVAIGIPVYIIQKIVIPFLETAKVLIPIIIILDSGKFSAAGNDKRARKLCVNHEKTSKKCARQSSMPHLRLFRIPLASERSGLFALWNFQAGKP